MNPSKAFSQRRSHNLNHLPARTWQRQMRLRENGFTLVFLALALTLILGFAILATYPMFVVCTQQQVQFAADADALALCSLSTDQNGTLMTAAQTNLLSGYSTGNAVTNIAPTNPSISNEAFVGSGSANGLFAFDSIYSNATITGQSVQGPTWNGTISEQWYLVNIIMNNALGPPLFAGIFPNLTASNQATSVAYGEPATRIGQGPAPGSGVAPNFAVLPIAIYETLDNTTNTGFAYAANQAPQYYSSIDISYNPSTYYGGTPGQQCIGLVNVYNSGSASGGGTSTNVSELEGLLEYFNGGTSYIPAGVEAGSVLNTFTVSQLTYSGDLNTVYSLIAALPTTSSSGAPQYYIFPVVIDNNNGDGQGNGDTVTVAGFAWLELYSSSFTNAGAANLQIDLGVGQSMCVYNAACGGGLRTTPPYTTTSIPTPPLGVGGEFKNKGINLSNFLPPVSPNGVALGPALVPSASGQSWTTYNSAYTSLGG